MIDPRATPSARAIDYPPILATELAAPAPTVRPWYLATAPAFLGLFAAGFFFDQLWLSGVSRATLGWHFGEALVAPLACYFFFYWIPAMRGLETRRRLVVVAASTFGTVGSEWLTGVAIGVAAIVWYAVTINFALDTTLMALVASGCMERSSLAAWRIGPVAVKSVVFCAGAAFWIFITGMSSVLRLTGVVVALMRVYAPVALLLLTATAVWLSTHLGSFDLPTAPGGAAGFTSAASSGVEPSAIEQILGFFAMSAMISVDWGASSRSRRDVILGGSDRSWDRIILGRIDGTFGGGGRRRGGRRVASAGRGDGRRRFMAIAVVVPVGGAPRHRWIGRGNDPDPGWIGRPCECVLLGAGGG